MNRNMAILFSNATVLPMTAAGNAPRTFAGWVGVDGNRIALVTESETAAAEFRAAHPSAWAGVRFPWAAASRHPVLSLSLNQQ